MTDSTTWYRISSIKLVQLKLETKAVPQNLIIFVKIHNT